VPTVSQQCEPFHRCSYRRDADLLPTEYQGDPIGWPPEERGHWSGHKRTKLGESFQVSMALWSAVSVSREFEYQRPLQRKQPTSNACRADVPSGFSLILHAASSKDRV
jgi:hypothetical protein